MKWIALLLLVIACHRQDAIPNSCGVNDPLNDLPWLKKLNVDTKLGSSIAQGEYQGQTVYAVSSCERCIAGPNVAIYRCDGSLIYSGLVLDKSTGSCSQIKLQNIKILVEYDP